MACPFFYPTEAFGESRWRLRPQMPLGDPYDGACRAEANEYRPGEEELRTLCNLGYARGKCPRFVASYPVDALRFTVNCDVSGRITITYVQESDHRPFGHGRLEYHTQQGGFIQQHPEPHIQRQAEAYVRAYLRRKALPAAAGGPSRR